MVIEIFKFLSTIINVRIYYNLKYLINDKMCNNYHKYDYL